MKLQKHFQNQICIRKKLLSLFTSLQLVSSVLNLREINATEYGREIEERHPKFTGKIANADQT
jgi:hypothetical protein